MRSLFFLAASANAFSTNALPASPHIRASSTQMAFVADVADALPLPTEVTNAAQTLSPYVSSGVEKLSGALETTPVANYFDNPLYEPAASLVVLYAGYTVAGFVLQVIVQIVLFPLLESSAGRDFLNPDKYVVGKRLGGGSYGTVYEAYKTSGAAVEVASEDRMGDSKAREVLPVRHTWRRNAPEIIPCCLRRAARQSALLSVSLSREVSLSLHVSSAIAAQVPTWT